VVYGGFQVIWGVLAYIGLTIAGISILTLLYFLVSYLAETYRSSEKGAERRANFEESEDSAADSANQPLRRAVIHCTAIPPAVSGKFNITGYSDCRIRNMVFGGDTACSRGCLGAASCVRVCPNDAIVIRKSEIGITAACNGCGLCITACPRHLIEIVDTASITATMYCAASGKEDCSPFCPVARDGYSISGWNIQDSIFKNTRK
jgi:Pyruvate/2-oxoacid:ferredoxin oxidoreductase delta subunit